MVRDTTERSGAVSIGTAELIGTGPTAREFVAGQR